MPSRVMREEMLRSASLSRVSLGADLLFRSLVLCVDDYGRFDGRAQIILATAYPLRREVTPDDVEGWLRELTDDGCVELYEADGKPYIQLTGWERHRGKGLRGTKSKYPPKPGGNDEFSDVVPCVYFVEREPGGPVKIGVTGSLWKRLEAMATTIPKLAVVAIVHGGDRALEKRLHRLFAADRDEREWFRLSDEMRAWIDQNATPPPEAPTKRTQEMVRAVCPACPVDVPDVPDGQSVHPRVGSRESGVGVRESGVGKQDSAPSERATAGPEGQRATPPRRPSTDPPSNHRAPPDWLVKFVATDRYDPGDVASWLADRWGQYRRLESWPEVKERARRQWGAWQSANGQQSERTEYTLGRAFRGAG